MIILKTKDDIDLKVEDVKLFIYLYGLILTIIGDSHIERDEDINDYLGGYIYIIEKDEDLELIYTSSDSKKPVEEQNPELGGWASIVEKADIFDQCEYILEGKYVAILLCTNNNGGNLFIVPKEFVNENIELSIELTKKAWGG